jgi:uncharacterized membrane protein YsdA (DUF1294 family)
MAIASMVVSIVVAAVAAMGFVGYLIDKSADREKD